MRRRRYLSVLGLAAAVAGCVGAPSAPHAGRGTRDRPADQSTSTDDSGGVPDDDSGGTSDDSGGDGGGSDDNDPYGDENVGNYRHDKGEWFDLDDDVVAVVSSTARRDAEAFGESGEDVYVVELRVENRIDEPVELEHDPFWLEKLGPEHTADSDLSEQIERGATGEATRLAPGEHRRLKLAFRVPDDVEPEYLWVNAHYICLVL